MVIREQNTFFLLRLSHMYLAYPYGVVELKLPHVKEDYISRTHFSNSLGARSSFHPHTVLIYE